MYKDVAEYVKYCLWCQVAKGPNVGPKTQPGSIIANGPHDLLCVDFTTVDPSRDGKENVLVLTDAFSKFSQAFVTLNRKALIMAKVIVDNWFYVHRIPAWIRSDKGWSFENAILEHLYTMYGVTQSTTTCTHLLTWLNSRIAFVYEKVPRYPQEYRNQMEHVPHIHCLMA